MRLSPMAGVALAWLLTTAADEAAKPMQPPMNDFGFAYYNCADGAFQVTYDSPDAPTKATMVTSDNNRTYQLSRTPDASGVAFSGGGAKFWTDGKAVVVQGASTPLKNCKLKSG